MGFVKADGDEPDRCTRSTHYNRQRSEEIASVAFINPDGNGRVGTLAMVKRRRDPFAAAGGPTPGEVDIGPGPDRQRRAILRHDQVNEAPFVATRRL